MNTSLWYDAAELGDDDYDPRLDDPNDTTPDYDEEAQRQDEMLEDPATTVIGVCMFCSRDIYAALGECEKGCGL